jgi:5'-nucleotidase
MLENGVSALPAAAGKFLQIAGFKFTYDVGQPVGSRIVSVMFPDNTAIPEDGTVYTLATNDYMNSGGDGYTMLADGEGNPRDVMADVLLDYIVANEPLTPYTDGRIAEAN